MLNYPIQGFSADLMILIRRIIYNQWPYYGEPHEALLNNTVHDDVEADVINSPDHVRYACEGMSNAFNELPKEAARWYGADLTSVPFAGEVKFGLNLLEENMSKYKKETFLEEFHKCLRR